MSVQLGWFAEDFKLLSRFQRLIRDRIRNQLNSKEHESQSGMFRWEENEGRNEWLRICLPQGLHRGKCPLWCFQAEVSSPTHAVNRQVIDHAIKV